MKDQWRTFLPPLLCFIGDIIGCRVLWASVRTKDYLHDLFKAILGNPDLLAQMNPELKNVDLNSVDLTPLIDEMYPMVKILVLGGIFILIIAHSIIYYMYTNKSKWAASYLRIYSGTAAVGLLLSVILNFKPSSIKYILWAGIFAGAYYQNHQNKKIFQA